MTGGREKFLHHLGIGTTEGDELALMQWFSVLEGKRFARTNTGKALLAYLWFQNGLDIYGVETLLGRVKRPSAVDGELRNLWQVGAPVAHPVWRQVEVKWRKAWNEFFDPQIGLIVQSRPGRKMGKKKLLSLWKQAPPGTPVRAQLELQLALGMAAGGKSSQALKALGKLLKAPEGHVDKNLVSLTMGRLWYPQGKWDQTIASYRRVAQDSDYWFVAQEELAWAYMSKGAPEKALAVTSGLMSEDFAPYVGPDTLFLNGYSQLKTCDYFGASGSIDDFKRRFGQRAKALMRGGTSPRYASRDRALKTLTQIQRGTEWEKGRFQAIRQRVEESGVVSAAVKRPWKVLLAREKRIGRRVKGLTQRRVKEELHEIKVALQQMHILEAELIQQIAMVAARPDKDRDGPRIAGLGEEVSQGRFPSG